MGSTEESWLEKRYIGTGTFTVTPRVRELVNEVLDSGRISYGEKSKLFETEFARIHGCKYGILSNSGTSSLQVALGAMKSIHSWPDGASVIVPATTFVATANIVRHCRLVPVFVDVERDTFNINVNEISKFLEGDKEKNIVAIIPVHLFGLPADVRLIKDILQLHNRQEITIVEDSCESMFVTLNDQPVGSLGGIGCFSMYAAHLITTGVGGIAITNNPSYAAKMRSLVNHGLDIQFLNPDENFSPRPMLNRKFIFSDYGYSYRITELEAAVGIVQLEDRGRIINLRRRNANHLNAGIHTINDIYDNVLAVQYQPIGTTHAHMMFPLVLNPIDGKIIDKTPLVSYLNDRGIETRDMLPLLHQPIYSWLNPKDFPVSDWLVQSGFYVGCHQDLSADDIQYVVDCILWFFDKEKEEKENG